MSDPRSPSARSSPAKSRRDDFAAFVCEQLSDLPDLKCRAMFGGHGLYARENFFGIVWHGTLFFRTSAATVGDYLAADMGWFQPNDKQALKNYYEVPPHIVERLSELLSWARRAIDT